jgi:hypothetical protein
MMAYAVVPIKAIPAVAAIPVRCTAKFFKPLVEGKTGAFGTDIPTEGITGF